MLNPAIQIFQIQRPYVLEVQQFNPPSLIYPNYFVPVPNQHMVQHPFFYQQTSFQKEYLNAYLYYKQRQALYQNNQNFYLQNDESSSNSDSLKVEAKLETLTKVEQESFSNTAYKIEEYQSTSQSVLTKEESEISSSRLLIIEMLQFFIKKFGQVNKEEISRQRSQYTSSSSLLELFDSLTTKYTFSTKCREDMVRFTLRKAMTFLRDSLRDRLGITAKAASVELCKRYFQIGLEEKATNIKNEREFMSLLLPYKKNSRNKTANSRFIKEIFESEAFYQDYLVYLSHLDEILELENQKKIDKFVIFLEECVRENSFHKIKQFKRVPWLERWLFETKTIAYQLLSTGRPSQERATITDFKKLKTFK